MNYMTIIYEMERQRFFGKRPANHIFRFSAVHARILPSIGGTQRWQEEEYR
jgi:hypothetical protein